jgi:hypothetical protein
MFNTSFEINDKAVIPDLVDLLHENVYLTFAPMQPSLFPDKENYDDVLCRLCDAPNVEFIVARSKPVLGYCAKHSLQKQDDETLVRVRNAEEARAAVKDMQSHEAQQEAPAGGDPLAEEGDFINKRNRNRSKRGR